MENWLNKILKLTEQTGDRCIVTDSEGRNVFVVMSLDQYQGLRGIAEPDFRQLSRTGEVKGLTEEQLLNRINREIASWKSSQYESPDESLGSSETAAPSISPNPAPNDEKFYFEPVDEAK